MANKVSKVCEINKLIIPVLECDDKAANPIAPVGKKHTNYNFVDAVNAAMGEFAVYNSDALAAAGGVNIGEFYIAGALHVEGAVHGTPKLRTV
jgi:hypothetical protein